MLIETILNPLKHILRLKQQRLNMIDDVDLIEKLEFVVTKELWN